VKKRKNTDKQSRIPRWIKVLGLAGVTATVVGSRLRASGKLGVLKAQAGDTVAAVKLAAQSGSEQVRARIAEPVAKMRARQTVTAGSRS